MGNGKENTCVKKGVKDFQGGINIGEDANPLGLERPTCHYSLVHQLGWPRFWQEQKWRGGFLSSLFS